MRSFTEILTEAKKTYPFKIGVAGDLPEDFAGHLETALQKYSVAKLSTGKKTPIQERPLDFPQLQNMEVTYYEVEVNYPTTTQVLQEYLGKCCEVPQSHIIVRNPNEPQELYQEPKSEEPYETLLTKEDMGGEGAQDSAGQNRIMDLLKELETARKENRSEQDPVNFAPKETEAKMSDNQNTKSVVGS